MRFLWDDAKSRSNVDKHGVSFEEAAKLLSGSIEYLEIFDEAHSVSEDRFIAIGPIARGVILVVFVEPDEETVRIISARKATRVERQMFATFLRETQL